MLSFNLMFRSSLAILLAALVASCAQNKDNSEPPAELTEIDSAINLKINWTLDTQASSNNAAYRLRPLIVGNRVYSIDPSGIIKAVDLKSGQLLWQFDSKLSATAGLGGNSKVLIASSINGDVVAYKLSSDGLKLSWKVQLGSEIRARPKVDKGQVFVRSVDGKLRSFSTSKGRLQWTVSRQVPSLSLTGNSEPLVHRGLIFAGFDDGKLVAYSRKSGKTFWEVTISRPKGRTEIERLVDIDGRFVVRDGIIYVASYQGKLSAIEVSSGEVVWSRKFSSFQSIAIDKKTLYLSADNSHLWAIDRFSGSALWQQDILHARKITAPSLIGNKLVVADLDGFLHWFSKADGKLIGRLKVGEVRSYVQPLIWKKSIINLDLLGILTASSLVE